MIETKIENDLVLPQWLPFQKAAKLREATALLKGLGRQSDEVGRSNSAAFLEELRKFHSDPNPFVGAELMGVSVSIGREAETRLLAEYVRNQPDLGPVPIHEAERILGRSSRPEAETNVRIASLKRHLSEHPSDAVAWIEQARYYTILGQLERARKSVMAALHLAPTDRFVVRAAIRFFVHNKEWDTALRCAFRAYSHLEDPLILGPLLSVGTHLNMLPNKMKPIAETAFLSEDVFLYSETLEAIGTLEARRSALARAKRFFKRAWMDPTRAVIGHSQWVLRQHLPGLADDQKIDFDQSHEAMSWLKFSAFDISGAMARAEDWALEEPYSRAPYILGSSAACVEERYMDAIGIARRGLMSNPKDDVLLNNLAYAELRNGKVADGEIIFAPLRGSLGLKDNIAALGTYGLLLMMKGDIEGGAEQYRTAAKRASELGNRDLVLYANLNFAISMLDVAKKLDVELLRSSQVRLATTLDPGSVGAAMALQRRIVRSDLTGSDELSVAAREFAERAVMAKERLLGRYGRAVSSLR